MLVPVSSKISDLCETSDLLYNCLSDILLRRVKLGDYFFDVCCAN